MNNIYIRNLVTTCVLILGTLFQLNSQMQMEPLNRGLVAIRQGNGYYINWRLLGNEPWNTGFNLYRESTKLNTDPITSVTSFLDTNAPLNSNYYLRAIINEKEQIDIKPARIINNLEGENAGYFDIPLQRPANGAQGGIYFPNDASVGDLTGNGEYEIVLKWEPDNAKDNSQSGITDNVLLDAYTLSGTRLWRIDLGPNIRAGAHYTQFLVYDFDGDGRSEIMVKTAPGTKDGLGNYLSMGPAASANHTLVYRNPSGYILSGPEYLTVFNGATGKEMGTADYWPDRGTVSAWGDSYGNRVDRFNATVAYVDGERPSAIFQRGYYTRMTFAAWDWRNGQLTQKWTFDSNTSGNTAYYGQGNHSIHVIDANVDGRHDIVTGSAVISGNGTGMHTSGMGHGDATHVTFMKKGDTYPMIWMPHESGGNGVSLRYANNGQIIFNHRVAADIGRGAAAELDPNNPGFHFWASGGLGLYNVNGAVVGNVPSSINFVVWWNGSLSRELLDQNRIERWNISSNTATRLLTATGAASNNGTKATPTLQADLFGDWREEVILRRDDNQALRVYTSVMPTTHKLYTFMHDPVYRVAVSWQNSSYNQPPHPGFYVATDMDFPPPSPNIYLADGIYRGSGIVIGDLKVMDIPNAMKWEIMPSLSTVPSIYGDMNFYYDEGPAYLSEKEWLRTSMESRKIVVPKLATFTAKQNADIYLVHHRSITVTPDWLSEWNLTSETVYIRNAGGSRTAMNVYSKSVLKDDVINLGSNTNTGSTGNMMYFLVTDQGTVSSINEKPTFEKSLKIYPNPVKLYANIDYTLEYDMQVTIQVLDLNGRIVKTIESGFMDEGPNNTTFYPENLPQGIYIIRLTAGNSVINKKVILSR